MFLYIAIEAIVGIGWTVGMYCLLAGTLLGRLNE